MPTALQLVNRVRRRLKWEDVSSFSSSDDLTTVLLDFVNQAKRDVLETHEWDFDIRTDGTLTTIAPLTYDSAVGTVSATNGSTTMTLPGQSDYDVVTVGASCSRIRVTSDASFAETAFILRDGRRPATNDIYTLEIAWPGTTVGLTDTSAAEILTAEYVLPTTVRDVLSVMVEEKDLYVEFVDRTETIDRAIPNAFDQTSSQPEVCFVGGYTTPTVTYGSTATPGLGLWLYPVPSAAYLVRYTYRYRHASLSATTDTLNVPDHVADYIVDLAVVLANTSRVAPDIENARVLEPLTRQKIARAVKRTGSQPLESIRLRSHDNRGGGTPIGSSPRNPRIFYQP